MSTLKFSSTEYWDDGHIPPTDDFKSLPLWIQRDLTSYLVDGYHGGSDFIGAVLTNDLFKAIGHADTDSLDALHAMVMVIYNRMPSECWGSREKVAAWQKIGGWNGYKASLEKAQ
jgi:hypothetical protein